MKLDLNRLVIPVVLGVAILCGVPFYQSKTNSASRTLQLSRATPDTQVVLSRLSEDAYRLLTERHFTQMSSSSAGTRISEVLRISSTEVRSESFNGTSWQEGVKLLGQGSTERAIKKLEQSARSNPRNAVILNDLASAYLIKSTKGRDLHASLVALAFARRALMLDGHFLAAQFNVALALERLKLFEGALEAWTSFLKAESDPKWRLEAEKHHNLTQASLISHSRGEEVALLKEYVQRGNGEALRRSVSNFPRQSQRYLEEVLLSSWATAVKSGNMSVASEVLVASKDIAAEIGETANDWLDFEAIEAIERAGDKPERLTTLSNAHLLYSQGRSLYERGSYLAAMEHFKAAADGFRLGGSPFTWRAEFCMASTDNRRASYSEALFRLENLVTHIKPEQYPTLWGEIHWIIGLIKVSAGRADESLKSYQESLAAFNRAGEREGAALVGNLLSNYYDLLGDPVIAWSYRAHVLESVPWVTDPLGRRNIFFVTAFSALTEGFPEAAVFFQDEAIKQAEHSRNDQALAEAWLWRGQILLAMHSEKAGIALEKARGIAEGILDEKVRHQTLFNIMVAEGEWLSKSDPRLALQHLEQCVEFFREARYRYYELKALGLLASVERDLGDVDLAEVHLSEAIAKLDDVSRSISDDFLRALYIQQVSKIYDDMVSLQLIALKNEEKAFNFLEEGRSRVLLESLATATRFPITQEEYGRAISAELPRGTALISYSLGEDLLILWVVTEEGLTVEQREISSSRLEGAIATWIGAIRNDEAKSIDVLSKILCELLVPERVLRDQGIHSLIFVPEGDLGLIPYSALRDSQSEKFLIESKMVTVVPSARIFLFNLRRAKEWTFRKSDQVLVVANPRVRNSVGLPTLERAEEEALLISAYFSRVKTLTREAATKDAVLSAMVGADLLHIAAHSEVNISRPSLSGFVLSDGSPDLEPDLLRVEELYRFNLSSVRAAILAGCDTGVGRVVSKEGVWGIARAFLGSGVPTVVASLWPVSDKASAIFFDRFYLKLASGETVGKALKDSQLELLRNGDPKLNRVRSWASFEVFGSP